MRSRPFVRSSVVAALAASALTGCAGSRAQLPPAGYVAAKEQPGEEYVIGPLDALSIFVWRNPEMSSKVQVRPDGRITTPLVNAMPAVGKQKEFQFQIANLLKHGDSQANVRIEPGDVIIIPESML